MVDANILGVFTAACGSGALNVAEYARRERLLLLLHLEIKEFMNHGTDRLS